MAEADLFIKDALENAAQSVDAKPVGSVTLVGAGPGSPGLLTLDAVRALQEADSVLYDRLVPQTVLDLAPRDADFLSVGKGKQLNTDACKEVQDFIEDEMVRRAKLGERVVRLKGGDPFIFGRGGEEIARLRAEGVVYQVVPGITAAIAAGARLGIPLTMRNMSNSLLVVTGNGQGKNIPFDMIAQRGGQLTTVFYMALGSLPSISSELASRGLGAMPMACIENVAMPEQRHILSTVTALPDAIISASPPISNASIFILGDVVSCARGHVAQPERSTGLGIVHMGPTPPEPATGGCWDFLPGLPRLLKELWDGSSRLQLRVVRNNT